TKHKKSQTQDSASSRQAIIVDSVCPAHVNDDLANEDVDTNFNNSMDIESDEEHYPDDAFDSDGCDNIQMESGDKNVKIRNQRRHFREKYTFLAPHSQHNTHQIHTQNDNQKILFQVDCPDLIRVTMNTIV